MGRRGIHQLHPRVFHSRTATTPSVACVDDTVFRVAVKIDGRLVTTRRREVLAPVHRKVAARDLVLSFAGRRIVQEIYGIRVRVGNR